MQIICTSIRILSHVSSSQQNWKSNSIISFFILNILTDCKVSGGQQVTWVKREYIYFFFLLFLCCIRGSWEKRKRRTKVVKSIYQPEMDIIVRGTLPEQICRGKWRKCTYTRVKYKGPVGPMTGRRSKIKVVAKKRKTLYIVFRKWF